MTKDVAATFRLLEAIRNYADGAEDDVLSVLEEATDRSDGSDELNCHTVDWPTTYHFSPRRGNLLRPITINKDHRVLEIGAGTGVLTRHIAERGATVVALEGEPKRAEAAALRCSDLNNVEVVCGDLNAYEDSLGFDLVIVIGVLEYAGGSTPDDEAQISFLRRAVDLLRPDGALVLAIENQIGLKYLLGFSEDHMGEPWAGIEGYPKNPETRTFSRNGLASLLRRSGLPAQRWLYPYPDYKLPTTILDHRAFDLPDSGDFVDQLVTAPVQDLAHPPTRFCDDRSAHRVFLGAGLGPEVANSFLVLAARDDADLQLVCDGRALAWHYSSERLKRWRRHQTVLLGKDDLRLIAAAAHPGDPGDQPGWLTQSPGKDESFLIGHTLEQQALDACRHLDTEALTTVLGVWRRWLSERERPVTETDAEAHPFSAAPGESELPPDHLDVSLSNFVDTGDAVTFIDREWHAGRGVGATIAMIRALWYFALDLVVSGNEQPFEANATVDAITVRLAELAGLESSQQQIDGFISAETRLQSMVTGADADKVEVDLRRLGSTSRSATAAASILPVAQLRRDLVQQGAVIERLKGQSETAREHQLAIEAELAGAKERATELETAIAEKEHWSKELEKTIAEKEHWSKELEKAIAEKENWSKELEKAITEKENWSKELESSIKERDRHSKATAAEIGNTTEWAQRLQSDLAEQEDRCRTLETDLQKKDAWAHDLEIALADKEKAEAELREALDRVQEDERRSRTELETAADWAHELQDQLKEKGRIEADLEKEIAGLQDHELDLRTAIEKETADRGKLEEEIARSESRARALEDDLRNQVEERKEIDRHLEVVTLERNDLKTWKEGVTRQPLVRAALAVLRFFGRTRP